MHPTLCFRPLRPAVAVDAPFSLDLLLTITPPELPAEQSSRARVPLNLALVIDRSGSMRGRKLSHARKAARFLVSQLTADDRLALVTFDDEVAVLMPSTPVRDPQPFLAAIDTIESRRCTALFDGWPAGGLQVAEHLDPAALNRVLLLSDGHANRGLTNPAAMANAVAGLSQRGISTSALGLGLDFDEDLMGAIASAGEGTLPHIKSPQQLDDLYASELQGLANTYGRKLSLGIRGQHGAEVVDVLNDLPRTSGGNHQLPSLRYGQELNVAVRLQLPAWTANQPIASVRLAWNPAGADARQELIEPLTLPVRPAADIARLQAMEQLDRGDLDAADGTLVLMASRLASLTPSLRSTQELQLLRQMQALLRSDRKGASAGNPCAPAWMSGPQTTQTPEQASAGNALG